MSDEKQTQSAISLWHKKNRARIRAAALVLVIAGSFTLFASLKADLPIPAIISFTVVTVGMIATMLL